MSEIETERLRLRMFDWADLDALGSMYGDPDVMRYLATGAPVSLEETATYLGRILGYWESHEFGRWAVIDKSNGEFIGYSGLGLFDDRIELNYGITKKRWGKGYATEAARACVRYGFEQLNFESIAAVARVENVASHRVMKKLGMRYERELGRLGFDYVSYLIRRDEFQPGSSAYIVHRTRASNIPLSEQF